jgi:hypothetical protein
MDGPIAPSRNPVSGTVTQFGPALACASASGGKLAKPNANKFFDPRLLVQSYYQTYLGRSAESAGLNGFVNGNCQDPHAIQESAK